MQQEQQSGDAATRKRHHIDLTAEAQVASSLRDGRFLYEPMLSSHPATGAPAKITFLGKQLGAPIWISSMTGGTAQAGEINRRLARAARRFGLGMGLGSCRQLLQQHSSHWADFELRSELGEELPLYANLGIAQVEQMGRTATGYQAIHQMVHNLECDGLIIHVNPLQEFFQPEGDRLQQSPLATLQQFLPTANYPVIVKEVGQGMGPASLKALALLPLAAIDFAAFGGTNFSRLEQMRQRQTANEIAGDISGALVGHDAAEMTNWMIALKQELGVACKVQSLIVSGGVRSALDGYFYQQRLARHGFSAVYAMAGPLMQAACISQAALDELLQEHINTLAMAQSFLTVREN